MSVSITIYANALLDSAGVMFFRQRTFTRFISSVILWQQSYLCILLLHTIICQIRSEFSTLVKSDPSMSRTFVNKYWICLPVNNRIIVRITFLLLFRIVKHIFVLFLEPSVQKLSWVAKLALNFPPQPTHLIYLN